MSVRRVKEAEKVKESHTVKALALIILVFGMALSFGAGTQHVASSFGYVGELGKPLLIIQDYPLYNPLKVFFWEKSFGELAPEVFREASGMYFFGICITFLFMIPLSLIGGRIKGGKDVHGSASFAGEPEIKKKNLYGTEGVVLGEGKNGIFYHNTDEHVAIIAPTRSGKGVSNIIPTLFKWPESVVVLDIKGENFERTAGYRAKFGNVLYFNPTDSRSARFNPLLEIEFGEGAVKDAQNIAETIIDPGGKKDSTGASAEYWMVTGTDLLVALILHVLHAEEDKSLSGVYNFLYSRGNPEDVLEVMSEAAHLEDGSTHPFIEQTAKSVLNRADGERSGIVGTVAARLALFKDPIIAKVTRESDFKLRDLQFHKRPVSLYLVFPPTDLERLKPLFRIMINQICRELTKEIQFQGVKPKGERKRRLLMLLDEFPSLGKLSYFESVLSTIAQYKVKIMLIAQSINQLNREYGPNNSILENIHARVFHTPNSLETADMISRMMGQGTVLSKSRSVSGKKNAFFMSGHSISDQRTGRALKTPDEVLRLPEDEEFIFLTGMKPILGKKLRYFKDKRFKPCLFPAPSLDYKGEYPHRTISSLTLWASYRPGESTDDDSELIEALENIKKASETDYALEDSEWV